MSLHEMFFLSETGVYEYAYLYVYLNKSGETSTVLRYQELISEILNLKTQTLEWLFVTKISKC